MADVILDIRLRPDNPQIQVSCTMAPPSTELYPRLHFDRLMTGGGSTNALELVDRHFRPWASVAGSPKVSVQRWPQLDIPVTTGRSGADVICHHV